MVCHKLFEPLLKGLLYNVRWEVCSDNSISEVKRKPCEKPQKFRFIMNYCA